MPARSPKASPHPAESTPYFRAYQLEPEVCPGMVTQGERLYDQDMRNSHILLLLKLQTAGETDD